MREVFINSTAFSVGMITSVSASIPIGEALSSLNLANSPAETEIRLLEHQDQSLNLAGNIATGSGLKDAGPTEHFINETIKANKQAIAVLGTQALKAQIFPPEIIIGSTILTSFLVGALGYALVLRRLRSRNEKVGYIPPTEGKSNSLIQPNKDERPYLQLIVNEEYNENNPGLDV